MPGNKTLAELFVEIKVQNEKLLEALKSSEVQSNTSTKKMQGFFDSLNFKQFLVGAFGIYQIKRGFNEVIQSASDFEYQMHRVNSIFQVSSSFLQSYSKQVRSAAISIGVSPESFAAGVYQAASANIKLADTIKVTTEAAKLGVAGFTDTATALRLIVLTMNAYGKEAGDATVIADKYLHVQNRGLTVIKELSDALGRLIPFAATLNIEFSVMNGMVSALTASGLDAFETATALRSMMQALATPSEEQRKIWDALGIKWGEARLAGDGMVQVLKEINEKTKGSITLANALGINQRGLVALLALGGKSYGMLTQFIDENRKAVNLNTIAYEEMNKSFTRTIERTESGLSGMTGALGDYIIKNKVVLAIFNAEISGMNTLTKKFQDPETFKRLMETNAAIQRLGVELENLRRAPTQFFGEGQPEKIKEVNTELYRLIQLAIRLQDELEGKPINFNYNISPEVKALMSFMNPSEPFAKELIPKFSPIVPKVPEKEEDPLERIKREEEARKKAAEEAIRLEKERLNEIKSYTEKWIDKKISDWNKMYEYQFSLDENAEKADADRNKRIENLRIARMDSYYKTFKQENAMEIAKIENQKNYDLEIERINFKRIMDENDALEDGYLYAEQLNKEHIERMKAIEENASYEKEDANRQMNYRMMNSINAFADKYGDFLGQTVIQSKFSFQAIATAFEAMLAQMTAQILGRAAVWGLLSMITPGSFQFPGFSNIIKNVTNFPGFQTGGYTGFGSPRKPAGLVHKEEFVFPKPAVDTLGVQLLTVLKNIGTGTIDNRQLSVSFTDKYLSQSKSELLTSLHSLWREGNLSFMGV